VSGPRKRCVECGRYTSQCDRNACPRAIRADAEAPLMSQSEVAKEMGLSRARVGQIEQSALRKLRRLLAEHQ